MARAFAGVSTISPESSRFARNPCGADIMWGQLYCRTTENFRAISRCFEQELDHATDDDRWRTTQNFRELWGSVD